MVNIVMPMAGRGQRFADAGYTQPKPLIPIHGRPMTEVVIENLRPSRPHRFTFLILREHAEAFSFDEFLLAWAPGSRIILVDSTTQGAACTVLFAREIIDTDEPLMIANCDQWVDASIDDYLAELDRTGAEGLIMTMRADDPKWSFVRLGPQGTVVEVVEKQVVSNEATVGIYNFRRGSDFVRAADAMIAADVRVNGEFYVAPVYNGLIAEGQRVVVYNVGPVDAGMYGLGTPTDFERFVSSAISGKVKRPSA